MALTVHFKSISVRLVLHFASVSWRSLPVGFLLEYTSFVSLVLMSVSGKCLMYHTVNVCVQISDRLNTCMGYSNVMYGR